MKSTLSAVLVLVLILPAKPCLGVSGTAFPMLSRLSVPKRNRQGDKKEPGRRRRLAIRASKRMLQAPPKRWKVSSSREMNAKGAEEALMALPPGVRGHTEYADWPRRIRGSKIPVLAAMRAACGVPSGSWPGLLK